ncbi:flagellar basal body P-ring formation protein FlgA [Geobacter sulfurreducens]|uniref:Flagella basal body P-ring formation protein FlgA n=1 Tax=Geobacter sulfurreducens (strain ATCC 51573 / DSM 12127 / PCA) TaxID=243231 RepID=Q748F2_GEOSL|nr:flagellar basal body P-ring formation chaperone FlgA [Geobacter sulfurreducens]AAR36442.1 flagellar basal body P-ring formation protein FlgA [Geobacter sulfurreducens PCA]ADI85801.1 flagellar basal body P-ring formation protein FlgA [Geobacter sulfurreducens KN400]QVW34848.1 flagellar basal body P-ring formation protein FlgA [Geobacter sulfurreducens]UAC03718.1 flagellar basal body P-ring formation chaperone FlgA [Geobacter sulfurreducens]HBB70456.1 flagella basal body P-ring formation prot
MNGKQLAKGWSVMRAAAMALIACMMCIGVAFATTGTQVVKEAGIRAVVAEYVRERTAGLGVETEIRKMAPIGDLKLPAGTVSYEVQAPRSWEGWGRANLALIVRVDDRVQRNIPVTVDVEALADAVVAAHPLARGDIITSDDVTVQKRDISSVNGRVYRSIDEVVGKRVKNAVRANTPLSGASIEKVPLVKSGQLVTIIAESPALRLTATGKARGNGAEGDIIKVQNMGSLKEIPARVIDVGTVQVDF